MGAFQYTAIDTTGQQRKGLLEGDTAKQVRQMLRDQNLLPVDIEEVRQQEARFAGERCSFLQNRSMSAYDLALITRQLATLVHSGLPLDEALLAVSEQTEKPKIRSIIMGVRAKVMEGQVRMDRNFALEKHEVAAGFVLTCQSHPLSDRVVLSFDDR